MLKRMWVGHLLGIRGRSLMRGHEKKDTPFWSKSGRQASQEILKLLGICIATRLTVSHLSCQVLEGEPIHSSIKWKHTSVYI